MSQFKDNPPLTPLMDGHNWRLEAPLVYAANSGIHVLVPDGFVTDFASVPQIFWNIIPPIGVYDRAAVLHDYLYRYHLFNRARCDALLLEAMAELGTPLWKRWLIYINVRLFGWIAWNKEPKPWKR